VTSGPISDPVTMEDCTITSDTPNASLRQAMYGFRQGIPRSSRALPHDGPGGWVGNRGCGRRATWGGVGVRVGRREGMQQSWGYQGWPGREAHEATPEARGAADQRLVRAIPWPHLGNRERRLALLKGKAAPPALSGPAPLPQTGQDCRQ
jgi:hypothetical protein